MNLLFELTVKNFEFLFVAALIFNLSILLIAGTRALRKFPPLKEVNVLFHEKWASGNSNDTIIHKMGGANKVLNVIITDDELWIKPERLFAGFSSYNGLVRKIKLTDIGKIRIKTPLITISFTNENGSKSEFNLKLKDTHRFIKVVSDKIPETIVNQ